MSTLTPDGYESRIIDAKIERYLRVFGAVEITGTKWCGKTWTALNHAQSVSYVDELFALAQDDPSAVLLGDRPHVVDEWQLVPGIWDVVRHQIDRERGLRGGWILTGSSTPRGTSKAPNHSGAGRIGRVRMRPMSLSESGDSSNKVSLASLFEGSFSPAQIETSAEQIVRLACRGGWPEAIDMEPEDAQLVARDYLRLFRTESVPQLGKDPETMRRLLFSLARNLGQACTYGTLASDMADQSAGEAPANSTVSSYLTVMRNSYLLDEVPGWAPAARSKKRLQTKPKRYLTDPSLAVAQLGMSAESLLADWQTFGLIFENLCMRDLSVYAGALDLCGDEPLRYYRDDSGLETDAIIELVDGRWAALEIKVSDAKTPDAVASLKSLRAKLCENGAARIRPPEFMAVVTGVSHFARRIEEGIYEIPITALTA